jgi:DNA primase
VRQPSHRQKLGPEGTASPGSLVPQAAVSPGRDRTILGGSEMSRPRISDDNDLVTRFLDDIDDAGLVGEQENAITIFLAALSAALPSPLHVTVQGSSSAGKNYLMGRVADFLPVERKKFVSGMTPKVLMHAGECEYQHKAVFIAEYEGVSRADYAIRTMQSEKVIVWEFVDPSNKGIKKRTNTVKGPASFIQATTRPVLHPENETRLLFCSMDESETLTQEINRRQAREAALGEGPSDSRNFEEWHQLILALKETNVRVPFAPELALNFPTNVRSRRDFPKLLALINASAFLHQHNRIIEDGIVATQEDYCIAKRIVEWSYDAGPDKALRQLLSEAQKFAEEFSVGDLMPGLGWGHTKVYELLSRAKETGCVAEGESRGRYKFLRDHPSPSLRLPDAVEQDNRGIFRFSAESPLSETFNSWSWAGVSLRNCGK